MERKTISSVNRRRRAVIFISLVFMLSALAALTPTVTCFAKEERGAEGKVVVLIVDRVSPSDFPSRDTPFCLELSEKWCFGLMVTRVSYDTPIEESMGAAYVTLGSGIRSRGAGTAGFSFGSGELYEGYRGPATAGEYYSLYTGMEAPAGGIVSLGWGEVAGNNEADGHGDNTGLMGDLLAGDNLKSAVVGNSDTFSKPVRLTPLICCNSNGNVPLGDIAGGSNVLSPDSTGGYRMDPDRLAARAIEYLEIADIVFVDTGDTARIDGVASETSDVILEKQRRNALRRVDVVAEKLFKALDMESSLLLIVTPRAPSSARSNSNYLTPFIAAGHGYGDGLVTSSTTRLNGLIDNSDFLPTVLQFFSVEAPPAISGRAITFKESDTDPGEMAAVSEQSDVTRKARWPAAIITAVGTILVAALGLLLLPGARERIPRLWKPETIAKITGPASIVLLAYPLSMFLAGSFRYGNFMAPTIIYLAFSTVLGLALWKFQRRRKRLDPVVSISVLTGAVIIVDLILGGRLMVTVPIGSTALEGMRYFGLTNTMVSIVVACTVWAVAGIARDGAFKPGYTRLAAAASMLVVSLIIGLGISGANIGGFMTSAATFLIFFLTGSRERVGKWWMISVPVIAAAGTVAVVLLDAVFFHSHAGRAMNSGSSQMLDILTRKVAIQISTMRGMSGLVVVVIIAILALVLWMRAGNSRFSSHWEDARPQFAAFFSLWAGGLIAVLTNDTGFLMLGFMIYFSLVCGVYYLSERILEHQNPESPRPSEAVF